MARLTSIKSREQVRKEFRRKGVSIREWATANDFSPTLVYNILSVNSRLACDYGQSHQIAVRLGLKHGEITQSAQSAF
jgi:gp16 family phage-associated protein